MIRKLILIIALSIMANADLEEKIKNIIGDRDFNTHRNLINHIFKNESSFITNNQLNYTALTQELENNNLLKLSLGSTRDIEITFNTNNSPKVSQKILNDILKSLGQSNFITKESVVVNDNLKWTVSLKTAAAISPLKLSQELQLRNCNIIDIKREGDYKWNYSINTNGSVLNKVEDLSVTNKLSLKKPLKPYMIKISKASKITIIPNTGSSWYPNVVFYDKDLNITGFFEEASLHKSLKLDVPNNTKYIKIDDLNTLANIKQGINITKE